MPKDRETGLDDRHFLAQLVGDVIDANARLAREMDQSGRREVVRTAFAAIEGSTWLLREFVREAAEEIGVLTPIAEMALREATYAVDQAGRVVEQVKFIALPTVVRLAVTQARLIDDALSIDFTGPGWQAFRKGLAVRNRVTHPKTSADLHIDDDDVKTIGVALMWHLSLVEEVMSHVSAELAAHAGEMRVLLEALRGGESWALEAYRRELEKNSFIK